MTPDLTPPIDPDVAAAELALGLLEGDERAAALRRVLAEPDFALEVERWRAHFGSLFAGLPAVAPAPDLEHRVIARLDGPTPRRAAAPWKPLALISSLAAASMAGLLLVRPDPAIRIAPSAPTTIATPAPMVAAFMVDGIKTPLVATYDPAAGRLSMPAMPVPEGRSAQLWAIVGSDAPHPMGLFRLAGERVEADARSPSPMPAGTVFAISIEPLGGSPTGAPTGPVVGTATLVRA